MDSPVVLITGALTGIGRASAFAFAREGARPVVSGRRPEAGAELVTALRQLGSEAHFVEAGRSSPRNKRELALRRPTLEDTVRSRSLIERVLGGVGHAKPSLLDAFDDGSSAHLHLGRIGDVAGQIAASHTGAFHDQGKHLDVRRDAGGLAICDGHPPLGQGPDR